MVREIAPGVHWIQEPGPDRSGMFDVEADPPAWYEPGESVHVSQSAFLLDDDETLLFDTLSPASRAEILDAVESVLGDRGLDYLVVSHPDVPHAGNALAVLEAYPEATLVAPRYGTGHEHYHLADAIQVGAGDSIHLGEHVVDFHEATFLDSALSLWMTERTTGTLFPVDWLGFPHTGVECETFVDELASGVTHDRLVAFHGRVFFWFQYVDAAKTCREIDRVWRTFEPEAIAPAHGLVVREEPRRYVEMMKPVVEEISERGRVGTLG